MSSEHKLTFVVFNLTTSMEQTNKCDTNRLKLYIQGISTSNSTFYYWFDKLIPIDNLNIMKTN